MCVIGSLLRKYFYLFESIFDSDYLDWFLWQCFSEVACHCLLLRAERKQLAQGSLLALHSRWDKNSQSPSFKSGASTRTTNCLSNLEENRVQMLQQPSTSSTS
uniref:Uncharacterized protein n=1 Tax=Micrurus surinamensis TaxID=129470 RepID=A0A2D4P9S5_MICSU